MNIFSPRKILIAFFLLTWCTANFCAPSLAVDKDSAAHSEIDLWIINTRTATLELPDADNYHQLQFKRWNPTNKKWLDSSRQEFRQTQDVSVPLLFLIHGNWTKYNEAVQDAVQFQQKMGGVKCRMVIWTWPSERVDIRPRVDIKQKASRADMQAAYIVWFLREIKPHSRVTLAGFSFGARLACMALEEMATYEGEPDDIQINAVLMAAAFPTHWILPEQRFGNAVRAATHIDILYNPRDDKLKYYPLIEGICANRGPTALGATGISVNALREEDREKVRVFNVVRWIGADHSPTSSLRSMLKYGHFELNALLGSGW